MRIHFYATALSAALVAVVAVALAPPIQPARAETQTSIHWIELQDGVKARLLFARDDSYNGEKELRAAFQLENDAALQNHDVMTSIADQLFARTVLVPAETKEYRRAAILVLKGESKIGDSTAQVFEDFHYKRGNNTVWLREAGPEPWKIAEDPKAWTPSPSEDVDLGALGMIHVDFIGEIFSSGKATKTLGIEAHSDTKFSNTERKYQELKALWGKVDHDKLKADGFDAIRMENYDQPRLGRFHVRYRLFLSIDRAPGGDWPELPANMSSSGPIVATTEQQTDWANLASRGVAAAAPLRSTTAQVDLASAGLVVNTAVRMRMRMQLGDVLRQK